MFVKATLNNFLTCTVPENTVRPVFRYGHLHRILKSGYAWINPFVDELGEPIHINLNRIQSVFQNVSTSDQELYIVQASILYRFNPLLAEADHLPEIVHATSRELSTTVESYTSGQLRHLVAGLRAKELGGPIFRERLTRRLINASNKLLWPLGIEIPADRGIILHQCLPAQTYAAREEIKQHEIIRGILQQFGAGRIAELTAMVQIVREIQQRGDANNCNFPLPDLLALDPDCSDFVHRLDTLLNRLECSDQTVDLESGEFVSKLAV